MFPFLFFLAFFFSFCRNCRNFNPLSVTDFSQAGYFSLACPSLSFGNLKKSQLLFRAVRGSIGVKNSPPGNGSGYNLVTEANTLSWERVAGRSPDGCGAARGTGLVPPLFHRCGGPPSPRGRLREKPSPGRGWQGVALTGVGRLAVPALFRPSSAACGRHLPPGEG